MTKKEIKVEKTLEDQFKELSPEMQQHIARLEQQARDLREKIAGIRQLVK